MVRDHESEIRAGGTEMRVCVLDWVCWVRSLRLVALAPLGLFGDPAILSSISPLPLSLSCHSELWRDTGTFVCHLENSTVGPNR